MFIEISGAGFANKGAHLMLATVCQKLRQHDAGMDVSMPLSRDAYADRASYRLYFTVRKPEHWTAPRHFTWEVLSNIVGRTMLSRGLGLIAENKIDALIDISGYAFGDKWHASATHRFACRAAAYKRRGKPVVMLPQMLGPFTRSRQADAFRRLGDNVDLIYARDQESFEHAAPLVDSEKLRLAPDITIPTPPHPITLSDSPYACIVPNSKLLESNPQQQHWDVSYLRRLCMACHHLASRGIKLTLVQHAHNAGDRQLMKELQNEVGRGECSTCTSYDPQDLKAVLGGAQLVIGSRFHALVSALSMGVPAIALGWAHKYDALLRDFGTPTLIHYASQDVSHLTELIDDSLHNRDALRAILLQRKDTFSIANEQMWAEVLSLIGLHYTPARAAGD